MPQLKSNPRLADFLDGLGFLLASALLAWMCICYAQTPSPMHSEHQSIFGMEKEKNASQWGFKSDRKIPQGLQSLYKGQALSDSMSQALIPKPCAQEGSQTRGSEASPHRPKPKAFLEAVRKAGQLHKGRARTEQEGRKARTCIPHLLKAASLPAFRNAL